MEQPQAALAGTRPELIIVDDVQPEAPAEAPMKDGEFARKMFGHLSMKQQLSWALMLKRMKQSQQFRGFPPRLLGRRAWARAQGFLNHAAYARHVHQQQQQLAQAKAEFDAAQAGAYAPTPISQAVSEALH